MTFTTTHKNIKYNFCFAVNILMLELKFFNKKFKRNYFQLFDIVIIFFEDRSYNEAYTD